jgi:hypothetical protein
MPIQMYKAKSWALDKADIKRLTEIIQNDMKFLKSIVQYKGGNKK